MDVVVGMQREKRKPSTERVIDQCNRTIGCVHRSQDADVRWDLKLATGCERDFSIAVFEQIHQLAEHSRQVCPVDLVNNQDTATFALLGAAAEVDEATGQHRVFEMTVSPRRWANALNELFVGVSRVELKDLIKAFVAV